MDDSQNEAQLMGAESDHGTFVLLKSHQGHTSQDYIFEKSIPKQLLTIRHKTVRLQWTRDHMRWNIRSWQRVHWSNESRVLLNPVDGRIRVWGQRSTAFIQEYIVGTTLRVLLPFLNQSSP
jgi:hypothetical protein